VTVLDQQGVALSRNLDGDNADGGMSSRLELKKSTEIYLTKKAVEVLDRTFGPGQAIVSVDVSLTQDNVKITREDVIPFSRKDGEVAGAMTRKRQNMQVPVSRGYEAQAPGDLTKVDQSARTTQLSTLEIEYENGKKVEQTVMTPGSLRRISVGVILPGYVEPQKVQRVADIVAMAVGLNPERGDAIAVHSVDQLLGNRSGAGGASSPLDLPPGKELPAPASPQRQPAGVDRLVLLGATGLLVVLGLLFLVSLIGRRRAASTMSADEREKTLAQVKNWAQGGQAAPAQGST
jgi:flagellar M-ring protein FliF